MVDFHTHILPGIDDGSSSVDMSVEMIKAGMNQGIDTFVFTPHFYATHNTPERFISSRDTAFESLSSALKNIGLAPGMLLGCEVHYFPNIGSADISDFCIGDTSVVLLEPPFRKLDALFFKDVKDIINNQNLTVVIAHIERYAGRFSIKKIIDALHDCGAYIQSNAEFLIENKWVLKLYKDGYIDILGSDCHNLTERAPNMGTAAEILRSKLGNEYFDLLDRKAYNILI